jgi:Tol biopolymer transport system component
VASVSGRIAYSAGGNLYIVNAKNGKEMVAPIPGMRQPDFRADGELIIANGEGSGKDSLWTINANTGAFVRQQSPFTDDLNPSWSPDGGRFVYASYHHGLGRYQMLYTQDLNSTKKPPEVTLHHHGQQIRGEFTVWMHDDWIAFTACDYWPEGTGGSQCGIFRMPSWSGGPQRVVQGSLNMRATDNYGPHLLYMSQDSGNWEVYLVPNQGGASVNLSNSASSQDGLATFSPDGKTIAFVSNRGGNWAVWAVSKSGAGLTKLFDLPSGLTGTWTEESISWGP